MALGHKPSELVSTSAAAVADNVPGLSELPLHDDLGVILAALPMAMPLPELLIQHGTFVDNPPTPAAAASVAHSAEGSGRGPKEAAAAQAGTQVDQGALEQFVDAAVRQLWAHKLLDLLWRWVGGGGQ